jgi:uncharacterized protein (DUF885 family)
VLKLCKQPRTSPALVVRVEADHRRVDAVVVEQPRSPSGVFGRDDVGLAQDAKGPEGDILQIADRRGNNEKAARHRPAAPRSRPLIVHWAVLMPANPPPRGVARSSMRAAESLPHFVEDYLGWRHEAQPTAATFDGVHAHDDLVEDFSKASIDRQIQELNGFARRLVGVLDEQLPATERVEAVALAANVHARLVELENIRTWERDPRLYADTLAVSLASQAILAYAPAPERARRVVSKLRQVQKTLDAARINVKEPAGIFVRTATETLQGVLTFVERDLPRAFSGVDDLSLLGDLDDASTAAKQAIEGYLGWLNDEVAPRARASFRLGPERLARKLAADEGVTLGVNRLLEIGHRELAAIQDQFGRVAARLDSGAPRAVWARVKETHPPAGALVARARAQVGTLAEFIRDREIVSIPDGMRLDVGPTPPFYRWTFASLWAPGPFETRPVGASYYITDVDPSWPEERQQEHLRDFSDATLWAISMHEAYPGHFLHFQHLRTIASRQRKASILAPVSLVEGWAHYSEQMMIEEGFASGDPAIELGQLAEALVRVARLIVGLRLHAEDLSVEQGVRIFRDEAYLEEGTARREAERGTFDPGYVAYTLGKLMLLKLRADCKRNAPGTFSLRAFHDTLLGQGTLPFTAHRRLLLGENDDGVLLQ